MFFVRKIVYSFVPHQKIKFYHFQICLIYKNKKKRDENVLTLLKKNKMKIKKKVNYIYI